MAHYYTDMESWAQFIDNSTNTGIDDEKISGIEERSWGVREWLISATFLVVALIILSRSKEDEEDESSTEESNENESSPVERKRPDEETRKSNIMNLFLSQRNQQVRKDYESRLSQQIHSIPNSHFLYCIFEFRILVSRKLHPIK